MTIATHHQYRTNRTQAPLWHEDDFVSGHVQTAIQHWKKTILTTYPQRDEFLGYIGGVPLSEFIDAVSAGTFEGSQFEGADVTPIELPNHGPNSHNGWVDTDRRDRIPRPGRQPSAMVDGSGHQGPAPTAHMPPARGRAQQTSTYLGHSVPQICM